MPKVKTETQPLGSLPRNSNPERSMILARIGGGAVSEVVMDDEAVSLIPFEDAEPIRKFYAWPHRRVYDGLYWSSTTRTHVEFESLLAREFVMKSDFDIEVAGISAQPLAILWPYRKHGPRHHVPDYFVRLTARVWDMVLDLQDVVREALLGRRPFVHNGLAHHEQDRLHLGGIRVDLPVGEVGLLLVPEQLAGVGPARTSGTSGADERANPAHIRAVGPRGCHPRGHVPHSHRRSD